MSTSKILTWTYFALCCCYNKDKQKKGGNGAQFTLGFFTKASKQQKNNNLSIGWDRTISRTGGPTCLPWERNILDLFGNLSKSLSNSLYKFRVSVWLYRCTFEMHAAMFADLPRAEKLSVQFMEMALYGSVTVADRNFPERGRKNRHGAQRGRPRGRKEND